MVRKAQFWMPPMLA